MQETILRKRAVLAKIGMGPTWLHEEVKRGQFPQPVRLGTRAVGWKLSEVNAWLANRERAIGHAMLAHADALAAEGREVA